MVETLRRFFHLTFDKHAGFFKTTESAKYECRKERKNGSTGADENPARSDRVYYFRALITAPTIEPGAGRKTVKLEQCARVFISLHEQRPRIAARISFRVRSVRTVLEYSWTVINYRACSPDKRRRGAKSCTVLRTNA